MAPIPCAHSSCPSTTFFLPLPPNKTTTSYTYYDILFFCSSDPLQNYLDKDELDMEQPAHRHFILQIALKCADISNPCRPWDISRKWSQKVCEEFFRQGDYERQLNLPVTALCDRFSTSIPKIQVGFFKFVVLPLYEEWHRFLDDGFSRSLMHHLHGNQKQWEVLLQEEAAEAEAKAAAAAAAVAATTAGTAIVVTTGQDSIAFEQNIEPPEASEVRY